jgi:hypothetical protein
MQEGGGGGNEVEESREPFRVTAVTRDRRGT